MVNKTYEWTSTRECLHEQSLSIPVETSKDGLNCTWNIYNENPNSTANKYYFWWKLEWDKLKEKGVEGFEGTVCVRFYQDSNHAENNFPVFGYSPLTYTLEVQGPKRDLRGLLNSVDYAKDMFSRNDICFASHFVLTPIMNANDSVMFEKNFEASDKTDAILVVDGKKLHVSKKFLSFHSEFFNTLFNSDFKEKSMEEIPIGDVGYDDFVRLLSVVYPNPYFPSTKTAATLLKLADRFSMPMVIRLVEPFLIRNNEIPLSKKIALADKYFLTELMESCLEQLKTTDEAKKIAKTADYETFSSDTKAKLFDRILKFM